jgi:hypothetical protein
LLNEQLSELSMIDAKGIINGTTTIGIKQ